MSVRLDRWLKAARVFKTRTQAQEACSGGRVKVNGVSVKPHKPVDVEDRIDVSFGDWTRTLVIKKLAERPVAKALARELFEDFSQPRPKLDLIDRIMREGTEQRERGKGRPTKRERREIGRLKKR